METQPELEQLPPLEDTPVVAERKVSPKRKRDQSESDSPLKRKKQKRAKKEKDALKKKDATKSVNLWIESVNLWNAGRSCRSIPRKGTPEYDEVMVIRKQLMDERGIVEVPKEKKKNFWLPGLQLWNTQRGGQYLIPKAGTPEHAEILKIIEDLKVEYEQSKHLLDVGC